MPTTHAIPETTLEQANQLYWNSQHTVDDIVHRLGIGKSTLYSSVQPMPASVACPECGEEMVFSNRTNREAGAATCRTCGTVSAVEGLPQMRSAGARGGDSPLWLRMRDELTSVPPHRIAIVGGATALGLMLGAVVGRAVRELR